MPTRFFFYIPFINFISLITINSTNIKEKILRHHKDKQLNKIKINKQTIKKTILKSNILNNNLIDIEKSLLRLLIKNNTSEYEYLVKNQLLTKDFIEFFTHNDFNTNILDYDPKILEEMFKNKLDSLDNTKIVEILNNIKDLFCKINFIINIFNNIKSKNTVHNENIEFIENILKNSVNDEVLNDTFYFLNNTEKINHSICFNKKKKITYLICIYQNFDIFSELIYNYYLISIKLKILYNVLNSKRKYTYVTLKNSISKKYIKKMNLYKNKIKHLDKYIFVMQSKKRKNIKILHFYTPKKKPYNKFKITENIILGSILGLTIINT